MTPDKEAAKMPDQDGGKLARVGEVDFLSRMRFALARYGNGKTNSVELERELVFGYESTVSRLLTAERKRVLEMAAKIVDGLKGTGTFEQAYNGALTAATKEIRALLSRLEKENVA